MYIFNNLLARLLDTIAPRPCAICGRRLAISEYTLCTVCNMQLPRTEFQRCPYDNEMAMEFWGRIPIEKAAALFFFMPKDPVSSVVYACKYAHHPDYCEYMGRLIATEFCRYKFFDTIDAIMAMPLAGNRQKERGYNQSYEIAKGVSKITGIALLENIVARKTFEQTQTKLNRWERMENVEHAFTLLEPDKIKGKHILIIDDVVTTGASIIACATAMMACGDVKFSVLSLGFTKH